MKDLKERLMMCFPCDGEPWEHEKHLEALAIRIAGFAGHLRDIGATEIHANLLQHLGLGESFILDCMGNPLDLTKRNLPTGDHIVHIRYAHRVDEKAKIGRVYIGNHVAIEGLQDGDLIGGRCTECQAVIWGEEIK